MSSLIVKVVLVVMLLQMSAGYLPAKGPLSVLKRNAQIVLNTAAKATAVVQHFVSEVARG